MFLNQLDVDLSCHQTRIGNCQTSKMRKFPSHSFTITLLCSLFILQLNFKVPTTQALQQVSPTFIKDMNLATIKENTPIGEIVYTLEAKVDHPEDQVTVLYGIEGTQLFSVDKRNGHVRVAQVIDRELTSDSVTFQISATPVYNTNLGSGQPGKPQFGPPTQLSITVLILDENDNPPKIERVQVGSTEYNTQIMNRQMYNGFFSSSVLGSASQQRSPFMIRVNVSESAPVGSIIVDLIEAVDVDKASSFPLRSICSGCAEFELRSTSNGLLNDRLNSSLVLARPLVHTPRNNVRLLHVIVNDGKFNATIVFEITIEDVQNRPPEFVGSNTCVIQENAPIDKTIMTVQAIDGDAIGTDNAILALPFKSGFSGGRQILYDLLVNPDQPVSVIENFKLHPLIGQLQIANRIDREAYLNLDGILTLRVRARELTVNAYSIVHQDDLYTSILDKLASYVDPAPNASSETEISVMLVDINDNEPHWLNSSEIAALNMNQSPDWYNSLPNDSDSGRIYEIYVKENSFAGSPITTKNEMFVYDLDNGENATFDIAIVDPFNLFDVEPKRVSGFALVSLKLATNDSQKVQRVLDYENVNERSFIIQLIATEKNTGERFTSKAQVQIKVLDVNDNAPEFKESSYKANIREDAQAGKQILLIQASDKDEISKQLFYTIHGQSAHLFNINRFTGLLSVAKCGGESANSVTSVSAVRQQRHQARQQVQCIDFEAQRIHNLMVEVSDGELSSKVPLTIYVEDASDNPPIFTLPVVDVMIEEGDERLEPPIRIEATDADQTSVVSYSIVEGNHDGLFTINNATGEIQLTRAIRITHDDSLGPDYRPQTLNKMTLIVQATDGQFVTNGTIRIDVLDANDNPPEFIRPQYSVEIPESTQPGQVVVKVRANDLDRGNNAQVSYRIKSGSYGHFDIDESTGAISVSQQVLTFDTSKRENYVLEVVAYDHGLVSRSSSVRVNIRILDTIRKAPEFEPKIQRVSVKESVSNNTPIHRMTVLEQPDQPAGSLLVFEPGPIEALDKNGQPVTASNSFRLESMFSVSTNTGDVVVNSELDHDFAAYINLTIYVSSRSQPTTSLGGGYTSLWDAKNQQSDSVNEDEFSPKSIGYLIIAVQDENSNAPIFAVPWTVQQPELSLQMQEELPVGSILTQLMAGDSDSKISHFKIDPPNEYFELASPQSGVIINKKLIDYDTLMSQTFLKPHARSHGENESLTHAALMGTNEGNNIIQFNVYVFDSGQPQLSAKAIVSVEILPINDWDCIFEQTTYEARIKENAVPNTLLVQVRAVDNDYGEQHNTLRYQLLGEHSDLFVIDSKTGLVTVSRRGSTLLDRERFTQVNFTLIVLATDEPAPIGADENLHQTGYRWNQAQHLAFSGQQQTSTSATVNSRSCTTIIKVHLEDVNDNPPLFAQKVYEVTAYDTDTVEVPLLKLLVRDDDLRSIGKSAATLNSFKIVSGNMNESFNVTNAGLIYAVKPLADLITSNQNGQHQIQLRVQVKQQSLNLASNAPVSFTDECLVRVNLLKINRFSPEWRLDGSSGGKSVFLVEENSKVGTVVTQLRCIDRDYEQRNHPLFPDSPHLTGLITPIRYWIKLNGSNVLETNEFKLDSKSGNLTTRVELDRERQQLYQLVVGCEDNGHPQSLESVIPLFISVIDMDDNKPEFVVSRAQEAPVNETPLRTRSQKRLKTVSFSVEEHQSKGIPVGELKAIDRDLESVFPISYCLIEGNEFQEFVLDRASGILYTNQTLDRERQSSYELLVRAINDGSTCEDHFPQPPTLPQKQETNSTDSVVKSASTSRLHKRGLQDYVLGGTSKFTGDDSSLLLVKVEVLDINDNEPIFKRPVYRVGVHQRSLMNTLITQVAAFDPDLGMNGTLIYRISEIFMYKTSPSTRQGTSSRSGNADAQVMVLSKPIKLIQFPFRIDQQGNLYTQQLLTQYQLMSVFVLQLEATEQADPWRTSKTKVEVYLYETSNQLKISINLHPRLVETYRNEIESLLSNATHYTAIINRARSYHGTAFDSNGDKQQAKQPNHVTNQSHRTQPNANVYSSSSQHIPEGSTGGEQEASFSNIHLIFVDNFRIVNPNLVMEKFDLKSAQLFMPQTLNTPQNSANQLNNQRSSDTSSQSSQLDSSSGNQKRQQLQVNEVASLIEKIALASARTAQYQASTLPLAGVEWLESPAAIYITLTILLLILGFVIFLFGCCCTSRIKDHIVKVAMDKLVKQQTLQAKINEQVLAATSNNQSQVALNGRSFDSFNHLQQGGFISSFDATKGCIANNNENMSILQRAMESSDTYIDPNYATMNGHVNMEAHYYDPTELEQREEANLNGGEACSSKIQMNNSNGSSSPPVTNDDLGKQQHLEGHDEIKIYNNNNTQAVKSSKFAPNGNGLAITTKYSQNPRQRQQIPHHPQS